MERQLAELNILGRQQNFYLVVLKQSRICKQHGIIDLCAIRALRPSYPNHFIPFDGHGMGFVYEVIAEEIFKFLRAEGMVRWWLRMMYAIPVSTG